MITFNKNKSANSPEGGKPKIPSFKPFLVVLAIALLALMVLSILDSLFGYAMYPIRANQVGILLKENRPYQVVGPGSHTRIGWMEEIIPVNVAGLAFSMRDEEVLTKDQQRVGLEVRGTVHRPGIDKQDQLLKNWSTYSGFYVADEPLIGIATAASTDRPTGLMQALGQQAAKVCVGDLNFAEAVVGSARDVLRECIDRELDKLASSYGLEVRNVVVPNITLGASVQKKLDEITEARFATQLAVQNAAKAKADADRDQAIEEGKIRVEQARVQEKSKQDALTADLDKKRLEAQAAALRAQKDNELLVAQRDLQIAESQRKVAEETAKATLSEEIARASLLQTNSGYANYLASLAWANAYGKMDKVFLPPNVSPFFMISNGGVTTTVPIGPVIQPAK